MGAWNQQGVTSGSRLGLGTEEGQRSDQPVTLRLLAADPHERGNGTGTNYSSTYGALPLVPQPPGTLNVLNHPMLFVPSDVYLNIRGRLMSWSDSSDICYVNGAPYARVRGRVMSIKDKHTIETLDGTPLFNVKQVIFAMRGHHEVYYGDSSDHKACDIKVLNWGMNNVKFGVYLPGRPDPVMIIKGNENIGCYYGFIGNPKEGGQKVLNVTRRWDARGMLGGAMTYDIGISANVDIGLMLALGVAIDSYEKEQEEKRRS